MDQNVKAKAVTKRRLNYIGKLAVLDNGLQGLRKWLSKKFRFTSHCYILSIQCLLQFCMVGSLEEGTMWIRCDGFVANNSIAFDRQRNLPASRSLIFRIFRHAQVLLIDFDKHAYGLHSNFIGHSEVAIRPVDCLNETSEPVRKVPGLQSPSDYLF